MDDTLADESGIPFLNANDDIPVHSTPIKGGNVPLPSTRHVLKKMVQKTRQVPDSNPDFTASESIQAIQLSDTQALNGRDRDPVQNLGPRGHSQGQNKDRSQPYKKGVSFDRDDRLQESEWAYRRKHEVGFDHVKEVDNLRPRSKDGGNVQNYAGSNSKRPTHMYEPTLSRRSIDRLSRNFERGVEEDREARHQRVRDIMNQIDKDTRNLTDRETRNQIDRETRNYSDRLNKTETDRETRDHKDRSTRSNTDRNTDRIEPEKLQKEEAASSKDNKTLTDSAYSSYATSKSQWSKPSTSQQYSTERTGAKSEQAGTSGTRGRMETIRSGEVLNDSSSSSSNEEIKRQTVNSPRSTRQQVNKSATAAKKQQNSSLYELEGATLQKQRQEIELLMLELRDRDRELGDMADAHQQQLRAWEQDRHRLAAAEKLREQYEGELQSRSSQLHRAINSLKTLRSRECDLRQELKAAAATLKTTRTENTQLNADLEHEKNLKRQLQESLERISETVGRLEAREGELATNLKIKERDIASATAQMQGLSERLAQLDRRCRECQDREKEALAERDTWKQRHETVKRERKSLADEVSVCREEITRLSEENRSARQQLALIQKEMGMREKCKDELIESLKIKQERTDSQLRNIRELYEQQIREMAELQQRLDTSRQIIQHQQSSLDEQQLSCSFQSRRMSGISEYSMEKSVSVRSTQSSRDKPSQAQSSNYREPDSDLQISNQQSSGYQSHMSENQAARKKQSPVRSASYGESNNDIQDSNSKMFVYQSQVSENQTVGNKQSPSRTAKYREPDYDSQNLKRQSLGYQSQISENQTVRIKHSPVQSAKYREPDYDMQSSNHQSSGYQSQLSENQTGLVIVLGNQPQNHHGDYGQQQTGFSGNQNQSAAKSQPESDHPSRLTASVQSDNVPKHKHCSNDKSHLEMLKKRLEFSPERSPSRNKPYDKNHGTEDTMKHEKSSLPSDNDHRSVPKLPNDSNSSLQSPPRVAGFVMLPKQQEPHAKQSGSRVPEPSATDSRKTNLEPVEEQREVRAEGKRETTGNDSRLSKQDRDEMDLEMERKYVFENKLRSFLEDLDDIDDNMDSIWEDKTNMSLNISMVEGSPASKLQKLLLESRLMIQNLEKSSESPSLGNDRSKSNTPRQKVEHSEEKGPANKEMPSLS